MRTIFPKVDKKKRELSPMEERVRSIYTKDRPETDDEILEKFDNDVEEFEQKLSDVVKSKGAFKSVLNEQKTIYPKAEEKYLVSMQMMTKLFSDPAQLTGGSDIARCLVPGDKASLMIFPNLVTLTIPNDFLITSTFGD